MSRAKNKVLIVDDEETLTWGMSKSLSKAHKTLEILSANSGEEALKILEKTPIDIMITDIRMPGMSGLKLLSKVKSAYSEVDVIVMTAYGSSEVQQEAVTSGSLYYIEKPFEMEEMEELLDKALKKRSPHNRGFQGKVNNLQLADIIQINCLGKLTCTLKVSLNREEGEIYFQKGEVVHAQCGPLTGEEAFFKLMGWQNGEFETRDQFQHPPRTINDDWQSLLLRGSQLLDENVESQAIKYEENSSNSMIHLEESAIEGDNHTGESGKLAPQKPPPQTRRSSRYIDLSSELKEIEGVKGAVVVAKDGVVLSSSLEGADSSRLTDLWGATSLYLGGAFSQIAELLGLEDLRSAYVKGQDGRILIMEGRSLYFGLVLEEGAQKERLESEVKRISKDM